MYYRRSPVVKQMVGASAVAVEDVAVAVEDVAVAVAVEDVAVAVAQGLYPDV